jgi:outer membrane receptor for ferrienterochelin and colicin
MAGSSEWKRAAAFMLALSLVSWPAAAGAVSAAKDVRVEGRVVDAKTQQPIAEAVVFVRDWRALSDVDGRFSMALPPGRWTIEAAAGRYLPATVSIDACEECRPQVEIALLPARLIEEHVEVTASVNDGSALAATTPVRPAEVLNVAGAFENVFRVLQNLPGVTSAGEWSSRLSVRGGGPDQNMTVMDGVEIHNPYRLNGLVSAFNPETVETFELATGAFSARYGDRLSSILTIDTRPGKASTAATGSVGLSLTDSNAIAEGRLPGTAGSWLLTGRRTWYDIVAERFTEGDLPAFNDLQGKVALDLGGARTLTFTGLRSRERSDQDITEDFDRGHLDSLARNDVGSVSLLLPLGARGASRTIAAFYDNTDEINLDARFRDERRRSNAPQDDVAFSFDDAVGALTRQVRDRSLRQELSLSLNRRHLLEAGFEWHDLATRERLRFDLPGRPDEGLRPFTYSHDATRTHSREGAWLIDRAHLAGWLDLEAGLRYDRSRLNGRRELMPRLSLTARPAAGTRLRAAFGIHTQSPGYEKLLQADYAIDLAGDGRLNLANERARHYVLGIERDLALGLSARVEGFYKQFDDLLVGRLETGEEVRRRLARYDFPADLSSSVPRQPMITAQPTSDGKGRAYGFDIFLARRAVSSEARLSGWLAYTYTSANREAYGRTYPFDYEQPHALSVVANLRASQRLELSVTGRFTSGFPRTLPLGLYVTGIEDTADLDGDGRTDEVVPERDRDGRLVYAIDYGSVDDLNRGRRPWHARVDFRATFVPRWGKGRWRLYLDVLNLLGRDNGPLIEELAHDPSSTRPRIVTKRDEGFPFLPSFGIHVRF